MEFYRPSNNDHDIGIVRERRTFLETAAKLQPELLQTLIVDVFPLFQGVLAESGETRDWWPNPPPDLAVALKRWSIRWHLDAEWVRRRALATLDSWKHRLGGPQNQWPKKFSAGIAGYWSMFPDDEERRFAPVLPSWDPEAESWRKYEARVRDLFDHTLLEYRGHLEDLALKRGGQRPFRPRAGAQRDYEWLVRWQVQQWDRARIARQAGVKKDTIRKAVVRAAGRLGLPIDPGRT